MEIKNPYRQDSIKLGLMAPLSGIVGIYGEEISRAAQIACDEVNKNGGISGKFLELIIEDDGSLPKTSVTAAEKLTKEHKCAALIGNLLSNSRIAVAYQVAEPYKIPLLNFSFYVGSIMSRYFFHFAALPNQQIDLMIPFMKNKYGSKFFFAGNNYEWPRGSIDAAKRSLQKHNGTIIGEEYFPIGTDIYELEKLVDRISVSNADVFVPYFAGIDQVNLLTIFTNKNLKNRIAVVMGHYDEVMSSILPPEVRAGFYSSNSYFMTVNTEENKKYKNDCLNFPGISGIYPEGNGILTNFGEGTYLCVKAFAKAANQCNSVLPEDLVEALEEISLTSPQGFVKMDKDTHHARINSYLSRCELDGSFTIIEDFGEIEPIIPDRYRHLKIKSRTIQESEVRLQSRILEQISDGVSLTDSISGTILYNNPGFEKMFGYEKNELLNRHVSIIFAPENNSSEFIQDEINSILNRKGIWEGEFKGSKKDRSTIFISATITIFTHSEFGEVFMAVYKDITGFKKIESRLVEEQNQLEQKVKTRTEELYRAKETAERASKAKSDFLSNMSHELRTPLNGILGAAQIAAKLDSSGEIKKYINIINSSGSALLLLINDILSMVKIDSEELELKISKFSILEILNEALAIFEIPIKEKNLQITVNISRELPFHFLGDASKFKQILLNLLSNSVKFTAKGGIDINIRRLDTQSNQVEITIKDTGKGIDPKRIHEIFIPFKQEDNSIKRKYGGTGLGLTVSRSFIHAMGGEIQVELPPEGGSLFRFHINLRPCDKWKIENPDSIHCSECLNSDHKEYNNFSFDLTRSELIQDYILLVDDNPINLLMTDELLKNIGFNNIITSENGNDALQIIQKEKIGILLTDLHMPEMDGFELCSKIRLDQKKNILPTFPIIAFTADSLDSILFKCQQSGFDDMLTKPLGANTLLSTIKKWYYQYRMPSRKN